MNKYYIKVYDAVRSIPSGRVSTYGAIADYLAEGNARMVGWALNQCHDVDPPVPAHRVVNRLGELSGRIHFHPPQSMQERLEAEGIVVQKDKIQNFDKVFWHPSSK